jgi:hypothetical protein
VSHLPLRRAKRSSLKKEPGFLFVLDRIKFQVDRETSTKYRSCRLLIPIPLQVGYLSRTVLIAMSSGYGQNHNNGGHGPAHPNISNGSSGQQAAPASFMGFASPEESAAVDHALLESLFYNEMMMLDSSSPSSSNFLSQHFAGAVQPQHYGKPAIAENDATTIAEKEMLQDFGVTANSQPFHSAPSPAHAQPPQPYYPPPASVRAPVGAPVRTPPVPVPQYTTTKPKPKPQTHPQTHPQTTTHPHSNTPIYPAPVPLHVMVAPPAPQSAPFPSQTTALPPPPASQNSTRKLPALTIESPKEPLLVPQEKTQLLVDQFATLAFRLGIELPNNVLQSLTAAAAQNDPSQETNEASSPSPKSTKKPRAGSLSSTSSIEDDAAFALDVAPTVEELRKTAEEAIAAVTSKKRAASDEPEDASANRPLYSKRRKKPRLSDCESRLAELKKENELLKRHLQNVSNKALRFDQEKEEAGKRIQHLHDADSGPEEMDKAIKEFSDMYSDYGVNRQQELSFHLEQLQR